MKMISKLQASTLALALLSLASNGCHDGGQSSETKDSQAGEDGKKTEEAPKIAVRLGQEADTKPGGYTLYIATIESATKAVVCYGSAQECMLRASKADLPMELSPDSPESRQMFRSVEPFHPLEHPVITIDILNERGASLASGTRTFKPKTP